MSRLKLAATAAALLGGLTMSTGAQAFTFLEVQSTGQLFNFNSATGAIAAVGSESLVIEGLGQLGSNIYGETGTDLYSITLSGTTVTETDLGGSGLTGVSFVDFGSTTTGLFAIGNNGDLYSINKTTGLATIAGPLGLGSSLASRPTSQNGAGSTGPFYGLSTGSGTLYFVDGSTMYTVNTTTGVATSVGAVGGVPSNYGALMYEGGTLYGGSNKDRSNSSHTGLISFNSSYFGTLASETTPNPSHAIAFWGMAPGFGTKVVPEPATWALMLAGIGVVGGALRGRRRKATAQA